MADAAWLVGAVTIPAQSFNVNDGGGNDPVTVAAGTYYLRHATGSLSLIRAVSDAIDSSASAISVDGLTVRRSRHLFLDFNAAASVTWGTATIIRDLLGFSSDLVSAATHLAPGISPLLWSPGYLATPKTIAGVAGYSVDHKSRVKSDDGSRSETEFYGEETWQDLVWTHIVPERLRVATGTGGGTFHEFYEQCAKLGYPFRYYEAIDEDEDDTSTNVTWTSSFGPYKLRGDTGDWYRRNQPNAELSSPLELELHVVDEVA